MVKKERNGLTLSFNFLVSLREGICANEIRLSVAIAVSVIGVGNKTPLVLGVRHPIFNINLAGEQEQNENPVTCGKFVRSGSLEPKSNLQSRQIIT